MSSNMFGSFFIGGSQLGGDPDDATTGGSGSGGVGNMMGSYLLGDPILGGDPGSGSGGAPPASVGSPRPLVAHVAGTATVSGSMYGGVSIHVSPVAGTSSVVAAITRASFYGQIAGSATVTARLSDAEAFTATSTGSASVVSQPGILRALSGQPSGSSTASATTLTDSVLHPTSVTGSSTLTAKLIEQVNLVPQSVSGMASLSSRLAASFSFAAVSLNGSSVVHANLINISPLAATSTGTSSVTSRIIDSVLRGQPGPIGQSSVTALLGYKGAEYFGLVSITGSSNVVVALGKLQTFTTNVTINGTSTARAFLTRIIPLAGEPIVTTLTVSCTTLTVIKILEGHIGGHHSKVPPTVQDLFGGSGYPTQTSDGHPYVPFNTAHKIYIQNGHATSVNADLGPVYGSFAEYDPYEAGAVGNNDVPYTGHSLGLSYDPVIYTYYSFNPAWTPGSGLPYEIVYPDRLFFDSKDPGTPSGQYVINYNIPNDGTPGRSTYEIIDYNDSSAYVHVDDLRHGTTEVTFIMPSGTAGDGPIVSAGGPAQDITGPGATKYYNNYLAPYNSTLPNFPQNVPGGLDNFLIYKPSRLAYDTLGVLDPTITNYQYDPEFLFQTVQNFDPATTTGTYKTIESLLTDNDYVHDYGRIRLVINGSQQLYPGNAANPVVPRYRGFYVDIYLGTNGDLIADLPGCWAPINEAEQQAFQSLISETGYQEFRTYHIIERLTSGTQHTASFGMSSNGEMVLSIDGVPWIMQRLGTQFYKNMVLGYQNYTPSTAVRPAYLANQQEQSTDTVYDIGLDYSQDAAPFEDRELIPKAVAGGDFRNVSLGDPIRGGDPNTIVQNPIQDWFLTDPVLLDEMYPVVQDTCTYGFGVRNGNKGLAKIQIVSWSVQPTMSPADVGSLVHGGLTTIQDGELAGSVLGQSIVSGTFGGGSEYYTYENIVKGDNPIAYWRMGDTSTGILHDLMPSPMNLPAAIVPNYGKLLNAGIPIQTDPHTGNYTYWMSVYPVYFDMAGPAQIVNSDDGGMLTKDQKDNSPRYNETTLTATAPDGSTYYTGVGAGALRFGDNALTNLDPQAIEFGYIDISQDDPVLFYNTVDRTPDAWTNAAGVAVPNYTSATFFQQEFYGSPSNCGPSKLFPNDNAAPPAFSFETWCTPLTKSIGNSTLWDPDLILQPSDHVDSPSDPIGNSLVDDGVQVPSYAVPVNVTVSTFPHDTSGNLVGVDYPRTYNLYDNQYGNLDTANSLFGESTIVPMIEGAGYRFQWEDDVHGKTPGNLSVQQQVQEQQYATHPIDVDGKPSVETTGYVYEQITMPIRRPLRTRKFLVSYIPLPYVSNLSDDNVHYFNRLRVWWNGTEDGFASPTVQYPDPTQIPPAQGVAPYQLYYANVLMVRVEHYGAYIDIDDEGELNTEGNHVVFAFDGNARRVYINGELRDTYYDAQPGTTVVPQYNRWNDYPHNFDGDYILSNEKNQFLLHGDNTDVLDEVALYHYALDPSTISRHYYVGKLSRSRTSLHATVKDTKSTASTTNLFRAYPLHPSPITAISDVEYNPLRPLRGLAAGLSVVTTHSFFLDLLQERGVINTISSATGVIRNKPTPLTRADVQAVYGYASIAAKYLHVGPGDFDPGFIDGFSFPHATMLNDAFSLEKQHLVHGGYQEVYSQPQDYFVYVSPYDDGVRLINGYSTVSDRSLAGLITAYSHLVATITSGLYAYSDGKSKVVGRISIPSLHLASRGTNGISLVTNIGFTPLYQGSTGLDYLGRQISSTVTAYLLSAEGFNGQAVTGASLSSRIVDRIGRVTSSTNSVILFDRIKGDIGDSDIIVTGSFVEPALITIDKHLFLLVSGNVTLERSYDREIDGLAAKSVYTVSPIVGAGGTSGPGIGVAAGTGLQGGVGPDGGAFDPDSVGSLVVVRGSRTFFV